MSMMIVLPTGMALSGISRLKSLASLWYCLLSRVYWNSVSTRLNHLGMCPLVMGNRIGDFISFLCPMPLPHAPSTVLSVCENSSVVRT